MRRYDNGRRRRLQETSEALSQRVVPGIKTAKSPGLSALTEMARRTTGWAPMDSRNESIQEEDVQSTGGACPESEQTACTF